MLSIHKISVTIILLAQVHYSFTQIWPKYYSHPNTYDYSDDIIETYDHGNLICGNIYIVGSNTTQSSWLIKTDINGDTLWSKVISNEQEFIRTFSINQTNSGEFVVCGLAYVNLSDSYPYVMKLDPCMNKVWCKLFFTSEDNSSAIDIISTGSENMVVLINQFGQSPEETMHLFKLSSNGDVLWKKPFCSGFVHPEAAIPLGESVQITSSGKYLISGSAYWPDPWNPGGVKALRPTFTLIDSLGNEEWVLPFGLQDTLSGDAYQVIEKSTNEFIGITSYWPSQQEIVPMFVKFDGSGNELGYSIIDVKKIDSSFSEGAIDFAYINDSVFYASGTFEIENTLVGPPTDLIIDTNLFISEPQVKDRFIHFGEFWPFTFIPVINNKFLNNSTLKETGNWDIVLSKLNLNLEYDTLDTGNYTYDSLCTTPGLPQSGFIFLDDCDIITGVDIPSPEEYYANLKKISITAFPNPAKDKVIFAMENTEHHKNITLKCFNLLGKKVFETTILTGQKEAGTDVSRWPQGMYVAVVYSEGLPAGQCKFVVE